MATETITQITQPPEFIESEAKLYLDQLKNAIGGLKGADLSKILGPQFVAGLDPLTKEAMDKAGGLGSYAPYLQTAAGFSGPDAYKQFMSPYQQDVINTTLQEYDIQAQKGAQGVPAAAIAAGAFGGGREGVQRAEYQSASDRNRAALQAQLLQQGFGQAQQLAQQAQAQRMGVGAAQAGLAGQQLGLGQAAGALAGQQLGVGQQQLGAQLGLAGQQLGLGQFQSGLASQAPGLAGQEISALTTLGGLGQSQRQAQLSAQQQLASQQLYQPLTTAQQYGSGIMGLISGYSRQSTVGQTPVPGIAQTAIGAGTALASLYGAMGNFKNS